MEKFEIQPAFVNSAPERITLNSKYDLEIECFPSSFEEGWIRPQYRRMALSTCGDGVVKAKFGWLITTTSPKSMN
jgi:hypothetical protein